MLFGFPYVQNANQLTEDLEADAMFEFFTERNKAAGLRPAADSLESISNAIF